MSDDAKFEDGREAPLNLGVLDAEDLQVVSSLTQDGVFPITEMTYARGQRRFALLINRFRWEDEGQGRHAPERVQSVLAFDLVQNVATNGIDRSDKDMILSLLSVGFEPGEDGAGDILLTLAGDGAIRLSVEAIEATLKDVTRPYVAPSKSAPRHDD
ncbi:MAG: DUF2948 family protein [Tateyamaria sp.]|uniref:DUF2948 family protein n=1 Tax=Tateyamaria sp. TaxID=1929288 RepID=UPI00328B6129